MRECVTWRWRGRDGPRRQADREPAGDRRDQDSRRVGGSRRVGDSALGPASVASFAFVNSASDNLPVRSPSWVSTGIDQNQIFFSTPIGPATVASSSQPKPCEASVPGSQRQQALWADTWEYIYISKKNLGPLNFMGPVRAAPVSTTVGPALIMRAPNLWSVLDVQSMKGHLLRGTVLRVGELVKTLVLNYFCPFIFPCSELIYFLSSDFDLLF